MSDTINKRAMDVTKRLAVIIVYFGRFPKYMPYFLQSASYNPGVDFWIFTDAFYGDYKQYDNIKFIDMSLLAFNKLASEKTQFTVAVKNSYKLCDFKPMYGFILADYIRSYSHWAHCDVDMVFGNIDRYLTENSLYNYDVVSSHGRYISGAFTMYKNVEDINKAFMLSKDYKKVLADEKYLSFDEASTVIRKLWDGHDIFEFESEIESMSHVVKKPGNNINACFGEFIEERIKDKIYWREGRLLDGGKEIYIFHYLIYKGKISFNIPPFKSYAQYSFNSNGFFTDKLGSYTYIWLNSIYSNLSDKVKSKVKRKIKILTA
ncbi:DUF6625 family protein [Hymenobacter cavernae]|uniref:DUF6625 family protein n=1 Tax=Hymenobacter cavernae TaxID=2044852 RepID=UPI001E356A43|nr:DUF6625 family protein [Hymenobacter cavernae]